MAEVINLDELVPADIEFQYQGRSYVMPGDLDVATVFRLFSLFQEFAKTQSGGGNQTPDVEKAVNSLLGELLRVFQIREPALEAPLPFGVKALPIIMTKLLEQLGISVSEDAEGNSVPPEPTAIRPPGRKPKRTKTTSASPART